MAYVEWFTREYICANGVCEKTKYQVMLDGDGSSHAGREYKRTIRRAEKNATEAKNEAARIVNNNFFAGRDYLLTATLSDEGLEELVMKAGTDDPDELLLQMRREMKLWARRARRKLEGVELRYMAWPSDLDGKRLTPARPHLHVIVNAEGAEALLRGKPLTPELAADAGEAAIQGAKPTEANAYKLQLVKTLVKRELLGL